MDWTGLASVASAASALAAAISAYLSFRSIQSAAAAANEQRAAQAMLQYVNLSLQHKTLSTSRKGEDYEWYVIAVLETARQVLAAYPNDQFRRRQMKEQLKFHGEQLQSWRIEYPNDLEDYGPTVGAVVQDAIKEWSSEKDALKTAASSRSKR